MSKLPATSWEVRDPIHVIATRMARETTPNRILSKALKNGYELAESEGYSRPLELGSVEAFNWDELLSPEQRFSLNDGRITIYQYPSEVHDRLSMTFGTFVAEGLTNSLDRAVTSSHFVAWSIQCNGLVDTYNCSRKKAKVPDSAVFVRRFLPAQLRFNKPIVCEVAYRHESFVKLLQEGCHLLATNSDIIYAFLLFLVENETKNDIAGMRLVVMERVQPLASDDITVLPESRCRASPWPLNTDFSDICTEELSQLPVKIVFDQIVSRDTIKSISPGDLIDLDLRKINNWYALPLFQQPTLHISVRSLFKYLFEEVDQIKMENLYSYN